MASEERFKEMSEVNIQIEKVPGLLPMEKVTANLSKQTIRITQVHGSMQGKNIISMVETLKQKKEDAQMKKEERGSRSKTTAKPSTSESLNAFVKPSSVQHLA